MNFINFPGRKINAVVIQFSNFRFSANLHFLAIFMWSSVLHVAVTDRCLAQEIPAIQSFNRNQYGGGLKNWNFAEDDDGNLYVANTEGILIFNGMNWQKVFLPNHRVPRCVYKGYDGRIYAGGFETIGFIDRSNPAEPKYVEMGQDILKGTEEEIWHITGNDEQVMFQSFSMMVFLDSSGLELYKPQANIMFGNYIGTRLYVPQIEHGLYIFENDQIKSISPDGIPPYAIISGLQSYHNDHLLIATRNLGLFILDSSFAMPVENHLNTLLKNDQINDLLRLKNGDYAIGTIQNGVYIITPDFQIKYHLNKSNGLTNNSVLSLYETKMGSLCIGLNIGMNLLKLNEETLYYYDVEGTLGSVFTSIYYRGNFYLGTNQGVFIQNDDGKFALVPGSQGQVWNLIQAGGDLLCGHNSGTLQLVGDRFELVCPITGIFHMQLLNENQLLQSTYNGLILLEKSENRWQIARRIEGTDKLVDRFIYKAGEVVGLHPYFGMVFYKLDIPQNRVEFRKIFQDREINIGTNTLGLVELDHTIYAQIDSTLYRVGRLGTMTPLNPEDRNDIMRSYPDLSYRILKPINNNSEQNRLVTYYPDRNEVIRTIEEGYVKDFTRAGPHRPGPELLEVDYLLINNHFKIYNDPLINLDPNEQNITVQVKPSNGFIHDMQQIKYRLEGFDDNWQDLPPNGILDYKHLNYGQYHIQIQQNGGPPYRLMSFNIRPHWYEAWPGFLLYTTLIALLFWAINKRNKNQLRLETDRLNHEKEAALQAERIRAKTDKLEHEVAYKSKMLANTAMTMVQKNNMLNELKEVIKNDDSQPDSIHSFKRKLIKLINRNLNSDESWEIFDRNFAEVHQDFIERFTTAYPDITPGELRLAAYIRMNMSSKEIAPILQISVRSVENKRYRLRKKMQLESDTNLSEYLMRF